MGLKQCKECGRPVSTKASACPTCGAPVKPKGISLASGCLTILVVGILVGWLMVKVNDYANSPEVRDAAAKRDAQIEADRKAQADREKKLRESAQTFPAGTVIDYYASNEVAGDEALKDKVFKVSGVVDRVGKDMLNTSYVILKPSQNYQGIRNVQCFFDDSHNSELAAIQPGQRLVIFGHCKGLMMNVLMDNCEIIEK